MSDTPRTARWPLWGWYPLALAWLALLAMLALLTVFRTLKNIGSANLIQFDDVPVLHYFDLNYGKLFWGTAGLAAILLCGLTAACWLLGHNRPGWLREAWRSRSPRAWVAAWLPIAAVAFVSLALVECRYRTPEFGGPVEVHGAGAVGWLIVALAGAAGWLFTRAVVLTPQGSAADAPYSVLRTPYFASPAVPANQTNAPIEESGVRSQESGDGCGPSTANSSNPQSPIPNPESLLGGTPTPQAGSWASWLGRLAIIYLLCFATSYIESWQAHRKFWNKAENGNHDYTVYFVEGELHDADLVLHSTSMAFASLAAVGGCACFAVFHWIVPRGKEGTVPISAKHPSGRSGKWGLSPSFPRRDSLWIAGLAAAVWTFALGIPWQTKLFPEIKAEGGQGLLFVNIVLVFLLAGLAPLLAVTLTMLRRDFAPRRRRSTGILPLPVGQVANLPEPYWGDSTTAAPTAENLSCGRGRQVGNLPHVPPRPSEFALGTLVLFPVYPLLTWLPLGNRLVRAVFLAVVSAAMLAGMTYSVTRVTKWFTFDDWRKMVKGAELPFLKVFVALLAAYFVYLVVRRVGLEIESLLMRSRRFRVLRLARLPVQGVLVLAAAACFCFASWPFWGWNGVSKNTLARCVEFSDRHDFELGFLHWVFDCDRDGYAAVLHGADPDDFDPQVQAGGLGPPEVVVIPVDHFAIDDAAKAKRLPNLVIFYLEGVHPRAIGAYGRRYRGGKQWYGKDGPTPNIDSVASEGTVFTQARCFYPSTWDAWYATSTGRFMRIAEMDAAQPFGNRYNAHNNLYKVLYLAGFDRWCHADTSPYDGLLVPPQLHEDGQPPWDPDFDSRLNRTEEEQEVWRGDKRADRMVAFLDSIRPGERFFLCEHMADTHFGDGDVLWRKTSDQRAKELGFPDGLEPFTEDAYLNSETYRAYLQTITRMDAQIGRVLNKLRERKLYDNTMIVIVSDHGCQWWEHERMYYVSHIYEQSLLVPLIVRLPPALWEKYGVSREQRAKQYDEAVLQIDVLPTLMELAGARHVNPEATGPLPGRSLLPAMFSKGKSQAELDALAAGFRQRDVPLMTHYDMRGVLHDGRYKLIFFRPLGTYLIFDLQDDPAEMKNLADVRPELLDDLLERLRVLFTEHKTLLGRMEEDESWGP
jgi:arylsulfatase A-like enzyme